MGDGWNIHTERNESSRIGKKMADLEPEVSFDNVYQLETIDLALAGTSPSQKMNLQAQALLNRTEFIRAQQIINVLSISNNSTAISELQLNLSWLPKSVKEFGVIGDGVADDSAAMALVAAYAGEVSAAGLTILTDGFTVSAALKLSGGVIKFRTDNQRITISSNDTRFRNVDFDCNGFTVDVCAVRIPVGSLRYSFENCEFYNIVGTAATSNQYAMYIDADDTEGNIAGCTWRDISNESTPAPLSAFCGGILLSATTTGAKNLRIANCTGENIFSGNIAGDIENSDADAIRFFGPTTTVRSNVHISNFTSIDVQKSAIKTSGHKGLNVDGVIVTNDRPEIPMVAGVRFQAADESTISNINLSGHMSVGVNIRAKNTIVSVVNYNPIDTARDTVPGGLIQLQTSDTTVTEGITIATVRGRNVALPFNFDLFGITIAEAYRNITFDDFETTNTTVAGSAASKVRRAKSVTLRGVNLLDPGDACNTPLSFESVQGLTIEGGTVEGKRGLFEWVQGVNGCKDITIRGTEFKRPDSQTSVASFPTVVLQDSVGGALDDVKVSDITVSVPSYAASSNQDVLQANLTNSHIDGVTVRFRNVGTNPPNRLITGVFVDSRVANVKVSTEVALTVPAGTAYAVDLQSGSLRSQIAGVHNTATRGVRANAGANDNMIDTVFAKLNDITNSGTGNTLGTSAVIP